MASLFSGRVLEFRLREDALEKPSSKNRAAGNNHKNWEPKILGILP